MKNLSMLSTVALALTLFPACAKKKEDPKPAPQPIVQPTLVTAQNYISACETVAPNLSYVHVLFANAERVQLTTESYKSDRCAPETLSYRMMSTSTYKLGTVRSDKVLEIDAREETLEIAPSSQEQANTWNGIRYCGISTWTAGALAQQVSRAACGFDAMSKELPFYSIVKIEADRITLGVSTPNRGEDGSTPERRYTSLSTSVVYVKGNSVGVINPGNPSGSCPNLVGTYACTQGDVIFAGKNVIVTNSTNPNGRAVVDMELRQAGQPTSSQQYIPGDAERVVHAGGWQIVSRDFCEQGLLKSSVTNSREGDFSNRTVSERSFGTNSSSVPVKLVINTQETNYVNDRAERTQGTRTECVKIQ